MNEFSKLSRDQMRQITGGVPPPEPVCNVGEGCYQGLEEPWHTNSMWGVCTETSYNATGCVCEGEGGITRTPFCFAEVIDP